MIDFVDFRLHGIEHFRHFFMFTRLFLIILNESVQLHRSAINAVPETVCIACTRQSSLPDPFDLEWLEHPARDVSAPACTRPLDCMLRSNHFRDCVFPVRVFSVTCAAGRVLRRRPTRTSKSIRMATPVEIRTHFSVFSSRSHLDMLVNSATFSCGKNWQRLSTWM